MGALPPLTLLFLSTLSIITACNITAILENSNCKTFSSLITQTGVIKSYQTAQKGSKGLTIFAPSDDAFKEQGLPDLSKLTNAELVSLLHYHALPTYIPIATLKNMTKDTISTLATNPTGKYELTVKMDSSGNLTVETGVNSGKIESTAVDEAPVSVFVLDRILLPVELFGNATSPPTSPPQRPAQAPDAPAPTKSGASDMAGGGVTRAVLVVAVSVIVMVFLF